MPLRVLYGIPLGLAGQKDKAAAVWETACQRNPHTFGARQRLITHYAQEANRPDDAWRHVRVLKELKPPRATPLRAELEKFLNSQPAPPAR